MYKIVSGILLNAFCLFFAFETNAQQFKIISAEDGAVLPFATLINFTHPIIVSANANGIAELNAKNGDSIVVSYVGFKSNSFVFNSNSNQTIRLIKAIEILPPVLVQNCKKMKSFTYGNKRAVTQKKNANGVRCDLNLEWWGLWKNSNSQFAVRINPEKENTIFKSFSFWIEKPFFGPESFFNAPLIVSFYDVTDSITPGNMLTETPLIYHPQKIGKQTIDLDSFHLIIPKKGIYVSFQCVTNDDFSWTQTIRMQGSNKDTIVKCYGGRIVGVFSKDFEFARLNPIKNKWSLYEKKTGENDLLGTIKCEAVLKYCAD